MYQKTVLMFLAYWAICYLQLKYFDKTYHVSQLSSVKIFFSSHFILKIDLVLVYCTKGQNVANKSKNGILKKHPALTDEEERQETKR